MKYELWFDPFRESYALLAAGAAVPAHWQLRGLVEAADGTEAMLAADALLE